MLDKSIRNKVYTEPQESGQRLRLLGWSNILIFTLLIVAVMILLYPRAQLIEQVTQSGKPDPLSSNYLQNLLKTEPDNPALLLKRLQQQIDAGQLLTAERIIRHLQQQDQPNLRIPLAAALLELRERQAFAHPPGSPQRRQALPALQQAAAALAEQPLDVAQRERLAQKATAYGADDLAIRLYRGLAAEAAPAGRMKWIERAAQSAMAQGRYREAAQLHFDTRAQLRDPALQKACFLAGVRALQAGNLPDEALQQAEARLGELADDPDVLLFMIRLAQAANRNDRAEVYVRKLLRYAELGAGAPGGSPLQRVAAAPAPESAWIASDARALSRSVPACSRPGSGPAACWLRLPGRQPQPAAPAFRLSSQEPQLPFDDEIYRLGYEVFLANRNVAHAYAVAAAAVRQAPDNLAWRARLAQVAEWHGQPAQALEQWRYLALHQNSEQAWQALLRLAPGLFDEETVALALMREYRQGRLDDARLQRLVQAFEAMGEARKGVDFLSRGYRETGRRLMLERQAWLDERMGQPQDAIASLRQLERRHGLQPDEARRLASLLITQGNLAAAYQTLQQHADRVGRQDRAYHALLAELAWRLQDRKQAARTYQALQTDHTLEDHEAERLIQLMRDSNPDAAARLAATYWSQRRVPHYLHLALDLQIQAGNLPAAKALLASLTPAERAEQEKQTRFLLLRAQLHRADNHLALAIEDLRLAVQRQPEEASLQAQLLWLLIEARDRPALAAMLKQQHPRALGEPALWGPVGAGFALLARPRDALPYYARQASARRDDYLWQTGYAQILEEAGQTDMAWRIRRHAWLNLRRAGAPTPEQQDRWQALAQLALHLAPGDAGARWLREWLRLDGDGKSSHSPEARELATAWLLSNEQYESARLWLTQQYGKQLQAPGWADAALALQNNDQAALQKIMEGGGNDVATTTRVEAAMQLRNFEMARKLAQAGLELEPDNAVLHLHLTESLWQQQNRTGAGYRREDLGALRRKGWRLDAQGSLTPTLKMGLELSQDTLSSLDAARLARLPGKDSTLTVFGRMETALGISTLKVFYRKAVEAVTGFQLEHQLKLDRRLRVSAALGRNLEAGESDVLSAGGAKDALSLNAEWLISKRDYLLADVSANRYYGQDRVHLGNSTGLALQLGHHLRVEYPDLTLKLLGSVYRFDERSGVSSSIQNLLPAGTALLPESFSQYGIGIGIGETVIEQYSRAFRPYGALDLLHSSGAGWGYALELGFVLSPSGQDWLRGRYRKGQNAFGGGQDASLLGLEYRYLF